MKDDATPIPLEPVAWMKRVAISAEWDEFNFSANAQAGFEVPLYAAPISAQPPSLEPVAWRFRHPRHQVGWRLTATPCNKEDIANGWEQEALVPISAQPPSADAVDAARYRWWRNHGYTTDEERKSIENELLPAGTEFKSLDAAIDAAMGETQ